MKNYKFRRILIIFSLIICWISTVFSQDFPSKDKDLRLWYKSYVLKIKCDIKKFKECSMLMDTFLNSDFVDRRSILLYGAECYQETKQFDKMEKLIVEAMLIKHRSICKLPWSKESIDSIPIIKSYCDSLKISNIEKSKYTSQEFRDSMILYLIEDQGNSLDPKTAEKIRRAGYESYLSKSRYGKVSGSKLNEIHILELEKLISRFGFPNKKTVGNDFARDAVWLIIVHSENIDLMEKYLKELKRNFGPRSYSIAVDKILVGKELPQKYGTQAIFSEEKQQNIFYPIEDFPNVDSRRMKLGLSPLYIYAADVGVQDIEEAKALMIK